MRSLWKAFVGLLLVHVIAVAAFIAWLSASGRLDRERLTKTRDIFKLTLEDEKKLAEERAKLEAEELAKAEAAARLEALGDGPVTLAQRLREKQSADDVAIQRVERMQRDIANLRAQLENAKSLLAKQQQELDAKRKAFDEEVAQRQKIQADEDFLQAVSMYEQLKPRQAKDMFLELLKQNKEQEVINYLAAMQLRKAANVLKEFKTPEETAQATKLVQRLRERGVDPITAPNQPMEVAEGT